MSEGIKYIPAHEGASIVEKRNRKGWHRRSLSGLGKLFSPKKQKQSPKRKMGIMRGK